jgi:DNA polymerase I
MLPELPFKEVWCVDFEFHAPDGDRPNPVCLVAHELRSGRKLRLWHTEFGPSPPYDVGPDSLFVAYYASAEIGCHLALGWPKPVNVLDLFTEFRCRTNGLPVTSKGLLGALTYFGLDGMASAEKEDMRNLVLRGGPWTDVERAAILDHCESDVSALARLLPPMCRGLDLPRALLRGRYMAAAAQIEHNGVPVDVELLTKLRAWLSAMYASAACLVKATAIARWLLMMCRVVREDARRRKCASA